MGEAVGVRSGVRIAVTASRVLQPEGVAPANRRKTTLSNMRGPATLPPALATQHDGSTTRGATPDNGCIAQETAMTTAGRAPRGAKRFLAAVALGIAVAA